MASLLARHALRRARVVHFPRSMHTTPVALKKKGNVIIEDLFAEDTVIEEDLIKQETVPEPKETNANDAASAPTMAKKARKVKLEPAARQQRFDEQCKYIEARVGRAPTVAEQRVRKRHFLVLLDLAQSESDVRRVVDLIPRYREAGGTVIGSFGKELARRCQELQCQKIALEVFGNFARYHVPMDLDAGRWLVHSMYLKFPLEQVLIATALYPVYNLPPVNKDLPTAALVAAACYHHGTPDSIKAADALRQEIQEMLKKVKLGSAPTHEERKVNKWISWALRKVNHARKNKSPFVPQNQLPLKIELRSADPPPAPKPPKHKTKKRPHAKRMPA